MRLVKWGAIFILAISVIFMIRFIAMEPTGSIYFKIYDEQNPSVLNVFFRYVPMDFKKGLHIHLLENFNGDELICVTQNYGFPYNLLYIKTKKGEVMDFNKNSIGENLIYKFNINAFNYYLEKRFTVLDSVSAIRTLIEFLDGKCGDKRVYLLSNYNSISDEFKLNYKKIDFEKDLKIIKNKKDQLLILDRKLGVLNLSFIFDGNFYFKQLSLKRIRKTGKEMLDL